MAKTTTMFCAGCYPQSAKDHCVQSFARIGVVKVHWECWSDCNLSCSFCYRTRGVPLNTEDAHRLIRAIYTSGASAIVFAGGDPSIRPDIVTLIEYAKQLHLQVEIQTNAHYLKPEFLNVLKYADLVGVSLDGSDASTHDTFRSKPGNFVRVLNLLENLLNTQVPVVVRSIVAKPNHSSIPSLAYILNNFPNIVRWSLVEFSAIGDGYLNRERYEVDSETFNRITSEARRLFGDPSRVNIYSGQAKIGTYVLVRPDGLVYGTSNSPVDGYYPIIGSIVSDCLSELASKIPFSKNNHLDRYRPLLH